MNRKEFLRKTLATGAAASIAPVAALKARNIKVKNSDYDRFMEQVGFNQM